MNAIERNNIMDYFDYKRTRELEMEANKHDITPTLEDRIQKLEKRLIALEKLYLCFMHKSAEEPTE